MRTIKKSKTIFNYNSDMSGDVIIIVGDKLIEVNGSDLMEFFVEILRDKQIEMLEQQ